MKSSFIHWIGAAVILMAVSQSHIIKQRRLNDIPKIESTPPLTTTHSDPLENNAYCNQEMMINYGLKGVSRPVITHHPLCPAITNNCCTQEDALYSVKLWEDNIRARVERYYEMYQYSLKYVLGFTAEGYLLAREFEPSSRVECKAAAVDYLSMNLNIKQTRDMYDVYVKSLQNMGEVRRGFFCVLCDARTQSRLQDFYATRNQGVSQMVYFSQAFCHDLVDKTIQASYFTVNYFKRYSENLITLMNCKIGEQAKISYDIDYKTKTSVTNCYMFGRRFFFFFCKPYCSKFNLTKANPLFEGDLVQLKKFVDYLLKYRKDAFNYSSNNILMDGMAFEESYMKEYYTEVLKDVVFYRASSRQQVVLDQFRSTIVFLGGMNPWEACANNNYQLVLFSAPIVKAALAVIALIALFV